MSEVEHRADVRIHCAFAASDGSEPEPDAAVVERKDYDEGHPSRARLVVEVADSSLTTDRETKSGIYAGSGVPEYWIVNLIHRVIEVATVPGAEGYATQQTWAQGERFWSAALGVHVEVDAIVR